MCVVLLVDCRQVFQLCIIHPAYSRLSGCVKTLLPTHTLKPHPLRRFWRFVSQPPVRITEAQDENDTSDPAVLENPRFMAVVWGAGAQGDGPTTIVQLDGNGECVVCV